MNRGRSRTPRRPPGATYRQSATRHRSVSVTPGGSATSRNIASGKTSLKSTYALANRGKRTLKSKVKFIEKTLKQDQLSYILSENNFASVAGIASAVNSALPVGKTVPINVLTRGDTIQDRDGDQAIFLGFELSGQVESDGHSTIRVLLVSDVDADGTLINFNADSPATNYLFKNDETTNHTLAPWSMFNFNNTDLSSFRILHDEMITLSAASTYYMPFQIKRKLNVKTIYKGGTAGTISDISKNAMYLIFLVGGLATVTLRYDYVLYYNKV